MRGRFACAAAPGARCAGASGPAGSASIASESSVTEHAQSTVLQISPTDLQICHHKQPEPHCKHLADASAAGLGKGAAEKCSAAVHVASRRHTSPLEVTQSSQRPEVAAISVGVSLLRAVDRHAPANWHCGCASKAHLGFIAFSTLSGLCMVRRHSAAERAAFDDSRKHTQQDITASSSQSARSRDTITMAQCLCSHMGSLTLSRSSSRTSECSVA